MWIHRPSLSALLLALIFSGSVGCMNTGAYLVMPFYYRESPLPDAQVQRDLPYRLDSAADPGKHRLDLFLPSAETPRPWPVFLFVHGGGWRHGDRALRMGGADVYSNIGRFLASHGVGSAVISYRLQPGVGWQAQVEDVARAVTWFLAHVQELGGDPSRLFLAGHSAGAQLAAWAALNPSPLAAFGLPAGSVCGLIPVSGAGFDLEDATTYELGASRDYYEQRFHNEDSEEAWAREASPVANLGEHLPATLILYADGDWPSLRRQSQLLESALTERGADVELQVIEGEDHYTIVTTLSRGDRPAARALLSFIARAACDD